MLSGYGAVGYAPPGGPSLIQIERGNTMQRLWVTLCVPVDVEPEANIPLAETALDTAWQAVINPDEPPAGLVEHVSAARPALTGNMLQAEAA